VPALPPVSAWPRPGAVFASRARITYGFKAPFPKCALSSAASLNMTSLTVLYEPFGLV
jgi:hypothetical protein